MKVDLRNRRKFILSIGALVCAAGIEIAGYRFGLIKRIQNVLWGKLVPISESDLNDLIPIVEAVLPHKLTAAEVVKWTQSFIVWHREYLEPLNPPDNYTRSDEFDDRKTLYLKTIEAYRTQIMHYQSISTLQMKRSFASLSKTERSDLIKSDLSKVVLKRLEQNKDDENLGEDEYQLVRDILHFYFDSPGVHNQLFRRRIDPYVVGRPLDKVSERPQDIPAEEFL